MDQRARESTASQDGWTPLLSVVVPCFNEVDSLDALHQRLTRVCEQQVGLWRYEIVLVDDGSTDASWQRIEAFTTSDPHVVAVALSRNYGHELALSAGLTVCRGDRILIIDADLQDPPELLPDMMQLMDEGADVVYGQRARRNGESWLKKSTSALFYRLLNRMVDVKIPVDTGDFRLMTRRALEVLNSMPEQHRFVRGMISWVGFRQVPLAYERESRFSGETKYRLAKLLGLALDAITSFSIRPLRVASFLGAVFGMCAMGALAYALLGWAMGHVIPGWTSLMVVILTLGSAQLFMVGVMGEYLGRLYLEAKRRPLFVIDKVVRRTHQGQQLNVLKERVDSATWQFKESPRRSLSNQ